MPSRRPLLISRLPDGEVQRAGQKTTAVSYLPTWITKPENRVYSLESVSYEARYYPKAEARLLAGMAADSLLSPVIHTQAGLPQYLSRLLDITMPLKTSS